MDENGRGPSYKQQQQSCWSRRTQLEKILLFFVSATSLILIVTIIAAAIHAGAYTKDDNGISSSSRPLIAASLTSPSEKICLTEQCVKSAARILESIDQTVDPCQDFFEFACGKWNRDHPIPDERLKNDMFSLLSDRLQDTLKDLLEMPITDRDIPIVRTTKNIYQSCLNTTAIEDSEEALIRDFIAGIGGWPAVDNTWNESQFDLTELLIRIRRLFNTTPFLVMYSGVDEKNSISNIIQVDQPNQLPMEYRDYYLKGLDDRVLNVYKAFAVNVVKHLGATQRDAEEQISEMIEFEIELANITVPNDQRRANREAMNNKFTIRELNNLTTEVDWLRFISSVYSDAEVVVTADDNANVRLPQFVTKLGDLLKKTPKRTLQNYGAWWSLLTCLYETLSQNYQNLRKDFNKAMRGTDQDVSRWRYCVNHVNRHLGVSVGRMYVERYFTTDARQNALDMVYRVRTAFREMLAEVQWLGEDSKKVAQEKVDSIREKIGFPDFIFNDTALESEYAGIHCSQTDTFIVSFMNISRAAVLSNLQQLRLPVDRNKWSNAPVIVNAYYHPTKNLIMFPAGILQPPFYHKNNPMYLNFGGIASIIGHEITHGFDDQGRLFDKDGNVNQWWSSEDVAKFVEKTRCFIEQYSNYSVPEVGVNVNGKQTLGENIADNGGLKQAFRAYSQWVTENGPDELLPGVKLTQRQLFFLNYAQSWCGSARPEALLRWIRAYPHSPKRIRVIGTLSNSDEFAKAFSCAPDTPMNPTTKCMIW